MPREVVVVPHSPDWSSHFEMEVERIATVLDGEVVAFHHFGSTAVPGISAKPIIDILVEVRDIDKIDSYSAKMIRLGYEPRGEFGIPGRRYFPKGGEHRTHHVHIYEQGHFEVKRLLRFRDYLIAHPEETQIYSHLKEKLARQFPEDIDSYVEGKDSFIKELDKRAKTWKDRSGK